LNITTTIVLSREEISPIEDCAILCLAYRPDCQSLIHNEANQTCLLVRLDLCTTSSSEVEMVRQYTQAGNM
jgi:hypothetical protein